MAQVQQSKPHNLRKKDWYQISKRSDCLVWVHHVQSLAQAFYLLYNFPLLRCLAKNFMPKNVKFSLSFYKEETFRTGVFDIEDWEHAILTVKKTVGNYDAHPRTLSIIAYANDLDDEQEEAEESDQAKEEIGRQENKSSAVKSK